MFPVQMKSIDKVGRLCVPVMYLIGLKDDMINPNHTRRLFHATINSKHCQLEVRI
jgi:hypothetical protein